MFNARLRHDLYYFLCARLAISIIFHRLSVFGFILFTYRLAMEEIQQIHLHIDGQIFTVKKDVLCEHSDYFRAMFSGNFVEKEQQNITIDVVDAQSMNIILRYMDLGMIDLSEFMLPVVGNLAMAASFLQITELIKQIEYCLDLQLSISNWMETMAIAEQSSWSKLEHLSAAFGLLSFKYMQPEYVPTIDKLFWYLSHPYLDADSELDVLKFGFDWIRKKEIEADSLLIILGCLDMKRLTCEDLNDIVLLIKDYENSLAEKVVNCLQWLNSNEEISLETVENRKTTLCELFTETVYKEVYNLVKESKERQLKYYPAVPIWTLKDSKLEFAQHFLYTFTKEKGFQKWLEVADKNLWGWNVVSWGANKIVVVCGEHGRGTGMFMKDVKVYDTLRNEWINHGVQLPPRRHSGVTCVGDSMYIVGGVGGFRVVLDTAMIYNLKERTHRKIAKLPDPIQSPAVCTHKGSVYAGGFKNIYKYEDNGDSDWWKLVLATEMRPNRLTSFNGYIYCTQNYFSHLQRFRPEVDNRLELITHFSNPASAICNFRDHLLVFTRSMCGQPETISVEKYQDDEVMPRMVWSDEHSQITINDVAGSCTIVLDLPSLRTHVSAYHQRYISRYTNVF